MARFSTFIASSRRVMAIATFAIFVAGAVVGCQQKTSMIGELPAPNFDAPALAQQSPAIKPLPKMTAPPTVAKAPPANVPREWIPNASPRPWRWIVIHHSATAVGGAKRIDQWHRDKGWDELGYHFVIGNGSDTRDGQIEVGPRWPVQKWGAHAKTPDNRFNDYGIGICLVGNFDVSRPSDAQLKSVAKLVAYLMKTYHIPPDRVLGHKDTKPTECPGTNVHVAQIRQMATRLLAEGGDVSESDLSGDAMTAASKLAVDGELLTDQAGK